MLPQCYSVTLRIPAWAVMPGDPQAQIKLGPVPASAFGQLGSHCSWGHAAKRPRLQPALGSTTVTSAQCYASATSASGDHLLLQTVVVSGCQLPSPPRATPSLGELWVMSDTACPVLCKQVLGSVWQVTSLFCPGYLSVRIAAWLPRCCEGC